MPYAPGGNGDTVARAIAPRLAQQFGQQVLVENRSGAGGAVGTEAVVRAAPDGYTLLLHGAAIAVDPSARKDLAYDVRKDLVPISQVNETPFVVLVNKDLPVRSIAELIAYAKQNPGRLNYGSPGIGSSTHLATEYFAALAGINLTHVPYRGSSPALVALAANEVQCCFEPLLTAKPFADSGRARAIAVSTSARSSSWPELVPVRESGPPEYDVGFWLGFFAPANTPEAVIRRVNQAVRVVMGSDEMRDWGEKLGFRPVTQEDPAAFGRFVDEEIERWGAVVRRAGVTIQ
jgi:tripartite-type tricarboxylate transporter receptor subunit TctC